MGSAHNTLASEKKKKDTKQCKKEDSCLGVYLDTLLYTYPCV